MHRTCVAAHERIGNYWHMLPEYAQARKAMWDAINPHTGRKRIDEAFPMEIRAGINNQEMKIPLKCGSIWQLVGSDNFNSLIGSPPIGIVHSEHSVADPRAAGYLRPILAENNGWSLFIYTSRGYNHGYTTYETARSIGNAFAERLSVDQTDVFTPAQLEVEKQWYLSEYGEHDGDALFRQEYHCDFSAANIGAILGRYVEQAEKDGRISDDIDIDYDQPVEISSDIGFHDTATWWFWQPKIGGFSLVDYDEDNGLDAEEWIQRLSEMPWKIGKIWLPHDARAKTFRSKHTVVDMFLSKFGKDRVDIVPQSSIKDRINAARRVIRVSEFHKTGCKEGLDGLRNWAFKYDEQRKSFSKEPDHNWASHPGDGYSYGCQVMEERVQQVTKEKTMRGITVGANTVTLDEMWATAPKPTARI